MWTIGRQEADDHRISTMNSMHEDTSNILHHYPEDRYVPAALQLFASLAVMCCDRLRIFSRSRD